jgi:uncharacterized membrane protein YedE/YeeE
MNMALITALISGIIFGVGLALGGMLDPSKVVGFLDIFGVWDPSLAFVMGGGVIVNVIGHQIISRRSRPVCDNQFHLPASKTITMPLVIGSALFGIGWGVTGLCPGPAVASTFLNKETGISFILAVIVGLVLGKTVLKQLRPA